MYDYFYSMVEETTVEAQSRQQACPRSIQAYYNILAPIQEGILKLGKRLDY